MSQISCTRSGCKDVFRAFLVKDACFEGLLEIPKIDSGVYRPKKLIAFSKCISSKDYDCWVHFYEDDIAFERIWNNPNKYLPILKKFAGVITPDFSIYRDMPLAMQFWNIYRSRAIGNWLQKNGIKVIVNVRFGDRRTYACSSMGVSKNGTIAIGTHGCIRIKDEKKYLQEGLDFTVKMTCPKVIVIYGSAPDDLFSKYRHVGIEILQFDSAFAMSRKEKKDGNR